ncbi:MAG: NUDIX domain-containing protein [Planctomycetes bacterium]|nr:NUDIX domain-containing protein [Planctomycetota bacterium]
MRSSIAAFALFRRAGSAGRVEYLAQWNDGWNAFHFVGGHKREDESFRVCCVREVAEELGLIEGRDFHVAAERHSRLRYVHFSERAKAETDYTVELFDVELLGDAASAFEADTSPRRQRGDVPSLALRAGVEGPRGEENRWLTESDLRTGRCRDGRTVSPTMLRILSLAGLTHDEFPVSADREVDRPRPFPGVALVTPAADTPRPLVLWTVAAHRCLRQAIAEAVGNQGPNALDTAMTTLNDRLQRLFPGARAVVVQDQYLGYRRRDDEFILLVEVDGSNRPGRHVVKLANEERLNAELHAWESCRPHGLRHDLVFMTLDPCRDGDRLLGLVYADAQQFLGVPATSLEDAFLGAVCHGTPSPASLADVFAQLYERVGHLLYQTSYPDNPDDPAFVLDVPRLQTSLAAWTRPDGEPARVRQYVNIWAAPDRGAFRDPVDYLDCVCQGVPWRGDATEDGEGEIHQPAHHPGDPEPGDLVPRMLRGCAHGDLHGRNVLVGIVRDRARWPAVFDYEKMGARNLLAWDFVKMEHELKVRAYPSLFPNERASQFIRAVQDFEVRLAQQTEACYNGTSWPQVDDRAEPAERLRTLLLALRQQAALHLGTDRNRPRQWLDEYYFALACYGIHVGRFDNLDRPELLGAYLSAGVATARFLWYRE